MTLKMAFILVAIQPLMIDILRSEWKFDGYMVFDCGALSNFHATHKVTQNAEQSAAMAIKADVNVK